MAQSADPNGISAQRITSTRATSKVESVLWTRRSDRYTLQIVFPRTSRVLRPQANPEVTLWLLGADGIAIPTSRAAPQTSGPLAGEIAYSVSLSAGESAVAAAIKVDDEYFIERLQALK